MSENLDLVPSICADWVWGDERSASWARYWDGARALADLGLPE